MNEKFIMALEEAMRIDCENVSDTLPDEEPDFSPMFEKKMRKLIKRRSHSYYPLIATTGRRVACIAATVVIAATSSFSVDAVREAIGNLFIESYPDHHNISVSSIAENTPETIEEVYTIDVPEGFELTEDFAMSNQIFSKYTNGDKYIDFMQTTLSAYTTVIDNETTTMEILIIDGIEYHFFDCDNGFVYEMIWENDDYVFDINSNIDKESFIELCKSTKLK